MTMIPQHSDECPEYDGKRCGLMGRRPDNFCEPALNKEFGRLAAALARVRELEGILREAIQENAMQHTGPLIGGKCTEACVLCSAHAALAKAKGAGMTRDHDTHGIPSNDEYRSRLPINSYECTHDWHGTGETIEGDKLYFCASCGQTYVVTREAALAKAKDGT